MKILSIEITNFKKIEALLLELDGKSLHVAGTTGQGKTTAISTLWDILETVGDPITHSKKGPGVKSRLRLVLGDSQKKVIAERTYTAGGSTSISIRSEDGKEKISAKDFKAWVSSLAVNPHKIMDMGPKEQTEALLRAAKIPEGVDLEALDRDRAIAHEKREEARKEVARLKSSLGIKPRKVEPVELQETLERLQELQGDQAQVKAREDSLVGQVERLDQDIQALEERLQIAKKKGKRLTEELTELRAWASEHVFPGEIAELQERLSRSQEINEEARKFTEWVRENEKLEKAQADFSVHDAQVKQKDQQKRETLEAIQWPIPGCAIDEGVIHFRGVPLSQCGKSEQLLVCGALAADQISQAVVRVVRLDGVESMSSEDFAQLEALFEEHGIQVLSSRVSRGDLEEGEILIHEGRIQEVEL
jgi:hypothetical protein